MAPARVQSLDLANTAKAYFAPATVIKSGGGIRLINVSGQVGAAKSGHVPADYESQIHLALLNLRKIIIAAGATVKDVAKLTLYIVDYDPANRRHTRHVQRFLRGHRPAITLVPVAQLAVAGWLFEVDAVIACPESVPSSLPAPQAASPGEAVDVVIIGAGLAGLTAAHDVLRAGLTCVVLEARDRVGGKTWSQPLADGRGKIELGAAWINDVNQPRMIGLARRYGLELIEQNTNGDVAFQGFDGKASTFPYGELPNFDPATQQDVARIRDLCESDCQSLSAPNPQSTPLDTLTFAAYLRSKNASPTALATATVWTRAMLGLDPSDLSALFFLNYCKSGGGLLQMRSDRKGGGQHLRVREGTQAFSTRLAADLPAGVVRLNKPVNSITTATNSINVVDASGATYTARRVITTVPSPALQSITFTPPLHPIKQAWSQSAAYGTYSKAIAVFRTPFWTARHLCGLAQSFVGPACIIRDTSSPRDDKHVLTCFMVGAPGLAWGQIASEAERTDKLLQQIAVLYCGGDRKVVDENFVGLHRYDWAEDPWAGFGCPCASLTPGVLDTLGAGALREAVGGLHFAGTETAGEWKGYMEGAVRSGERAAKEVVDALAGALMARL